MYTIKRKRPQLNGEYVSEDTLPTSKKFTHVASGMTCVIVARNLEEKVALANAEKPEDLEGYTEALKVAQG